MKTAGRSRPPELKGDGDDREPTVPSRIPRLEEVVDAVGHSGAHGSDDDALPTPQLRKTRVQKAEILMGDVKNKDTIQCPSDLDRMSKVIWRKTRLLINKEKSWRPEYSILLERYVRAIEVGRLARTRISDRAAELDGERPALEAERDVILKNAKGVGSASTTTADESKRLGEIRRALAMNAYVARGSQGQLVQHPDLKTARDAERDANDYAKELLLTPAAREKLGDAAKPPTGGAFDGAF